MAAGWSGPRPCRADGHLSAAGRTSVAGDPGTARHVLTVE